MKIFHSWVSVRLGLFICSDHLALNADLIDQGLCGSNTTSALDTTPLTFSRLSEYKTIDCDGCFSCCFWCSFECLHVSQWLARETLQTSYYWSSVYRCVFAKQSGTADDYFVKIDYPPALGRVEESLDLLPVRCDCLGDPLLLTLGRCFVQRCIRFRIMALLAMK